MSSIQLYTREACGACVRAKVVLKHNQIPYEEIIIDETITREELLEQYPTARVLPFIIFNDHPIYTGYDGLIEKLKEEGLIS